MMKKQLKHYIAFASYPKTTILACLIFFVILLALLIIAMILVPTTSQAYNIIFALTTGAAGSFFVSMVVELSSNYRHNILAWHELQDYYKVVTDYEVTKTVMMNRDDENDLKDIVKVTWRQLPKLIPVLKETLETKKAFLTDEEINELRNILSDYGEIRDRIHLRLIESPMEYDVLNHPDEEWLKGQYPRNILNDMLDWTKKYIASEESRKAVEKLTDQILSDDFLRNEFLKDYDISQHGVDSYQSPFDDENFEPDVGDEEYDFSQSEDEEEFRREIEEYDKKSEVEQRMFVSWLISKCCSEIAESLDILENNIMKKPYYGIFINTMRKVSDERRVEKLLKRQEV